MDLTEGKDRNRYKKIKRISISEQVFEAIRQDIIDGVWENGEKLPTENEFAQIYGVNRLNVRMALQKLQFLGLTETVGKGTYLKEFSMKPYFDEVALFYENKREFKDIKEMRQLLESECIRLAAVRADTSEVEDLKNKLSEYNRLGVIYENNPDDEELLEKVVDADLSFHVQIIKMSHNRIYYDMYALVYVSIRNYIKNLLSHRVKARKENGLPPISGSDTHNKIYNAIANDDLSLAKELSAEMVGLTPVKGMDIFS